MKDRTSRKQRRPKMIIVDKNERRPSSRLAGDEFERSRSDKLKLIH